MTLNRQRAWRKQSRKGQEKLYAEQRRLVRDLDARIAALTLQLRQYEHHRQRAEMDLRARNLTCPSWLPPEVFLPLFLAFNRSDPDPRP